MGYTFSWFCDFKKSLDTSLLSFYLSFLWYILSHCGEEDLYPKTTFVQVTWKFSQFLECLGTPQPYKIFSLAHYTHLQISSWSTSISI